MRKYLLPYLQPSKMQHSCEANDFQLLVMHGLREVSVRDIILILPQVNPSHVAPDIGDKDTFRVLQIKAIEGNVTQFYQKMLLSYIQGQNS